YRGETGIYNLDSDGRNARAVYLFHDTASFHSSKERARMSRVAIIIGGFGIVIVCFFGTLFIIDLVGTGSAGKFDALTVLEATYGGNCKAKSGNLTKLRFQ